MKKEIKLFVTILSLILLTTVVEIDASLSYTNIISDPSFENWDTTPELTGWNVVLTGDNEYLKIDGGALPNYVNNDSYSAQFNLVNGSSNSFFQQTVDLTAGQEYTLELRVLDNDPDAQVWISLQGGGDIISPSMGIDSSNWRLLSDTFTASSTTTYTCYIYFHDTDLATENYVYVDGAALYVGSSTTNLFVNPSFESWTSSSDLTNWFAATIGDDEYLKIDGGALPNYVNNDSYSVQFNLAYNISNSFLYQYVDLTGGEQYTVELNVLDNDPDAQVWISLQGGGDIISPPLGTDSPNWRLQSATFTASATATYTCFIFFHDTDVTSENYVFVDGAALYLDPIIEEFNPTFVIIGTCVMIISILSIKRKR